MRAAMDGVANDRTISMSNSKPRPDLVPTFNLPAGSLTAMDAMVTANTSPALVTTLPVPPIDRICRSSAPLYFLFEPGDQEQIVVRSHRQQNCIMSVWIARICCQAAPILKRILVKVRLCLLTDGGNKGIDDQHDDKNETEDEIAAIRLRGRPQRNVVEDGRRAGQVDLGV